MKSELEAGRIHSKTILEKRGCHNLEPLKQDHIRKQAEREARSEHITFGSNPCHRRWLQIGQEFYKPWWEILYLKNKRIPLLNGSRTLAELFKYRCAGIAILYYLFENPYQP